MKTRLLTTIWVVAGAIVLVSSAFAQQPKSEKWVLDSIHENISLKLEDLLLQYTADEYADILEQLKEAIEDYTKYIKNIDDNIQRGASVDKLAENLKEDVYFDDPEQLLDDLRSGTSHIRRLEKIHRADPDKTSSKLAQAERSFRRELTMITELVENYADQEMVLTIESDEFQEYLDLALLYLEEALSRSDLAIEDISLDDLPDELAIPHFPLIIGAPSFPRIQTDSTSRTPTVQYNPVEIRTRTDSDRLTKSETSFTSSAFADVISAHSPIIISNPMGNVLISGWNKDRIKVTLEVQISSESKSSESGIAEDIKLSVTEDDDSYTVEVDLPHVTDPRVQVLQSLLTVKIPSKNKVICNSSFGDIAISNMRGGVVLESENSSVELHHVEGPVEVAASMGKVAIYKVSGRMNVANSYASIEVLDCDGNLDITNEYAPVNITDSRGEVTIENTGEINVVDHEGSIDIENAYGQVKIINVVGDIVVYNEYSPLIVSSVSGLAELANVYSQIEISDVKGPVYATNSYGDIAAEQLRGPVVIENDQGDIEMILDRDFDQSSSIHTTYASIDLTVSEHADLTVRIQTVDGDIQSSWPIKIDRKGSVKTAELVLGDGSAVVDVTGDGTTISIQDR
ncbi:MAG: hypothetical protein DRP45_08605 [Candidatus Zixiibacteriota bacterium]|nr:MAG: hypothetical protein DRP45_08605 [candidate division Zixibacteria bacterium]